MPCTDRPAGQRAAKGAGSDLTRPPELLLQTNDNAASTLTPARQQEFNERRHSLVEKIRKVREEDAKRSRYRLLVNVRSLRPHARHPSCASFPHEWMGLRGDVPGRVRLSPYVAGRTLQWLKVKQRDYRIRNEAGTPYGHRSQMLYAQRRLYILLSPGTAPKSAGRRVPGRLPSSRHPSYHPAMPSQLFASVIATLLLAGVAVAEAQQAARQATIGVLSGLSREERQDSLETFRRELRALGWEEGKNLSIEERYADGDVARLPALSEELVQRKVEIIVVSTSAATSAAMRATNTIPIVMVDVGDPLTSKFVSNLARPGGNVTGTTNMALGLTQKRLEILKEALPSARRIAMMLHPESVIGATLWRDAEIAARHLGLRLQRLEIRSRDDLRRAFQAAVNARADAMVPLADPLNAVLTDDILDLAARYRLPTMMEDRGSVDAGALLAYYSDPHKAYSRVAFYVARILDGTKPGELPVEQPTTFELAINLKTAKALGLTIPPSLRQRADQVIE